MKFVRSLLSLWTLAAGKRFIAVALVGLMFLSGALEMVGMLMLFAYISGLIDGDAPGFRGAFRQSFDALFGHDELAFALWGGLIVIAVFLFKNLTSIGVSFLNARFLMKLYERIAPALLRGFLRAPYGQVLAEGTVEPIRMLNQMLGLFNGLFGSALQVLGDLILVATILLLLVWIDPLLTFLASAMFGVALVAMHLATRRLLARMGEETIANQREAAKVVSEAFGGLIPSRLNATTGNFVVRYAGLIQRAAMMSRRQTALGQLPRLSNETLLAAGIVATACFFRLRGQDLETAMPTLALFGFAGLRLTASMSRIAHSLQQIDLRQGEFARLYDRTVALAPNLVEALPRGDGDYLADDRPLPEDAPGHFARSLELRQVEFAYREGLSSALRSIDLTIKPRSFTAICGPSGCGKTTLLLVMMGMLRPDSGTVECDGWDVFAHLSTWHRRIGYVGQRLFLPSRSIRQIVGFGRRPEEIDDEKVWHALETARLADHVRGLPDGLGAMLGENADRFSGGQRQRLDIARALYDDPEILFLDEATASLDNTTERELTSAIARIGEHKTIICVAHRLSSIRDADVIHFMEEGRIVASGTYDRLLHESPAFRRMAEAVRPA